ncbi:hypothetical protein V8F33_012941 [Rhypophila sp. PSN 637]
MKVPGPQGHPGLSTPKRQQLRLKLRQALEELAEEVAKRVRHVLDIEEADPNPELVHVCMTHPAHWKPDPLEVYKVVYSKIWPNSRFSFIAEPEALAHYLVRDKGTRRRLLSELRPDQDLMEVLLLEFGGGHALEEKFHELFHQVSDPVLNRVEEELRIFNEVTPKKMKKVVVPGAVTQNPGFMELVARRCETCGLPPPLFLAEIDITNFTYMASKGAAYCITASTTADVYFEQNGTRVCIALWDTQDDPPSGHDKAEVLFGKFLLANLGSKRQDKISFSLSDCWDLSPSFILSSVTMKSVRIRLTELPADEDDDLGIIIEIEERDPGLNWQPRDPLHVRLWHDPGSNTVLPFTIGTSEEEAEERCRVLEAPRELEEPVSDLDDLDEPMSDGDLGQQVLPRFVSPDPDYKPPDETTFEREIAPRTRRDGSGTLRGSSSRASSRTVGRTTPADSETLSDEALITTAYEALKASASLEEEREIEEDGALPRGPIT